MSFLANLGFDLEFYSSFLNADDAPLTLARVIQQHKGLLRIAGMQGQLAGEWWAELSGKLYYEVQGAHSLAVVGDWVLATPGGLHDRLQILRVLPRRTLLERQAIGSSHQAQLLAANVDHIFVVSSLNHELNLRRLERYRALVQQSGADATLLLTKVDLLKDQQQLSDALTSVQGLFNTLVLGTLEGIGLEELRAMIRPRQTYVFIGSSGVGKSTLVNALMEKSAQDTGDIRAEDSRGRHTTSSRSLLSLPGGALVIDTPGIRELGLWNIDEQDLKSGFADLESYTDRCRYRDCQHSSEPGCAVQAAIADGVIDSKKLDNFRKLNKEKEFQERREDKSKQIENKKKWKAIAKSHKQRKNLSDKF